MGKRKKKIVINNNQKERKDEAWNQVLCFRTVRSEML